jgi:hypothetical protein
MNDQAIEQEIQAKGLTAPRVTLADLDANIAGEHYFTASHGLAGAIASRIHAGVPGGYTAEEAVELLDGPLSLLTFCVLVLKNGFTVTGESACASPENFDAEIGRKIARENAINKVWPLMGYALKQELHRRAVFDASEKVGHGPASTLQPHQQRVVDERAELDGKLAKLNTFIDGATFSALDADEQDRLKQQAATMTMYSDILTERIAAF